MNEQINEANLCKRMLFDYKREWDTGTWYNMDELWKHTK